MFQCMMYIFVFIATSSAQLSCRDENNNPVDWFVIYKLPRLEDNANEFVKRGAGYAFITSDHNQSWTLSKKAVDAIDSIPGLTLAPIYEDASKNSLLYILYNDQPPNRDKFYYEDGGHAKGAVVADATGGFWMVHSVPRYAGPPSDTVKQHTYPSNAYKNGQSFLCITLKQKDLELVGKELVYNRLHIYNKSVPEQLEKMYPQLASLASLTWNSQSTIVSAAGTEFVVFAKSPEFNKELYSDWVAPALKVDLKTQTWPNGRSHQHSTCNLEQRVENVLQLKVTGIEFPTLQDHSKWAVSTSGTNPWVCVGDINKDDSQKRRGGGTVCTKDKSLWEAYHDTVVDTESCGKKDKS